VLLKDTVYRKEYFPSKESDTKLLQSIYFAYDVGIISFCSNRICHWKISKSRTNGALELHGSLRTVFGNHCSTRNTTPAFYDVTALAIKETSKHQRLADPLFQSGIVTRSNHLQCAINSTHKSIWWNRCI